MGFMEEYYKLKNKSNSTPEETFASSGSSYMDEYNALKEKRPMTFSPVSASEATRLQNRRELLYGNTGSARTNVSDRMTVGNDKDKEKRVFSSYLTGVAPTVSSPYAASLQAKEAASAKKDAKKDTEDKPKWYQKGHFEDGYDFGDVTKTILGIDEDSASLKDLTVGSLKRGYYNSLYGEESFKEMLGEANEKEALKEKLESEEYQFAPGNDFAGAVSGAFEQIGQMGRQFTNPRTLGFTGSAIGAAIIAGNAGPQALVPEEIISVPAVATAAFKASSAASNFEIEAGHAYNEMIELGIREDIAKNVALAVGGGNAALDLIQLDELFDAYKVTKASGATKPVSKLILDELKRRGVDVLTETAQEDAQELITVGGVQAASMMDKGEFAYSADEVGQRLWDTTKSSALTFGMMNAPATAKNTYSIIKDNKNVPVSQTVQNDHPIVEQIPKVEQEIKPEVEEVKPVIEVKPPEKKVLYTGSPNTDIKQFKVGGVDGSKQTGDRYGRGVYLTTNENTAKNYAGDSGRVYQISADDLNIFNLNDTITPEMRDSLIAVFKGGDTQFRNSMLRNFRTEMTFDDFESAEAFFDHQRKVWKEQDGEYSANKPEIKEADHETGRAVIEFTDFENWENNIGTLTGNHLYDALKSLSTDDFSSFITGHGFDGIAFDEDSENQQYVIYRNEDRLHIGEGTEEQTATDQEVAPAVNESLTTEEAPTISEKETVRPDEDVAPVADNKKLPLAEHTRTAIQEVISVAESGLTSEELAQKAREAAAEYRAVKDEDPGRDLGKGRGWILSEEQSNRQSDWYTKSRLYKALSEDPSYLDVLKASLESNEIAPAPKKANGTDLYIPTTPHWRRMLDDANGKGYDSKKVFAVARKAAYDELVRDVESGMSAKELNQKAKDLKSELSMYAELSYRNPEYVDNGFESLCTELITAYRNVAKDPKGVDVYKRFSGRYAPVASDIAPVTEDFSAPEVAVAENETTTEIEKLKDERQVLQDTIMSRVEVNQVDETTEMLANKWRKVDSRVRAMEAGKTETQPVAPKAETKRTPTIKEKIQQNDRKANFSFEKIFPEDNRTNRETYDAVLDGTTKAQDVISNGADGVKSVSDIFGQIKRQDLGYFNLYLYHYLNIDRTTLESRFGKENRPVFGEEGKDAEGNRYIKSYVTAEQSQKIIDDLEARHPEFKAVAEEVYAYCDYIARVRLESGDISQETYDDWREKYPHYVPISRTRWDTTVSEDLVKFLNEKGKSADDSELDDFLGNVKHASTVFSVRSVGDDLRLAMDALVDQTYRAFWAASVSPHNVGADTQTDIAPTETTTSVEDSVVEAPVEAVTEEAPVLEEAPVAETVQEAPVEAVTSSEVAAEAPAVNETPVVETPVTPEVSAEKARPTMADVVSPKPDKKGVKQKLLDTWYAIEEFFGDKGFSFERLAKKTDNRQLEADWDMIRRAPSMAQHLIGNGSEVNGVRSLVAIHEEVKKAGTDQDFSDYLGHLRNMDGLTQYMRYGISNQSFMGRETSVAKSAQEISRLEAEHPEFKQLAQDVYKYNDYLIQQMVDHGLITQDNVDMWKELYPHYVPMRTANGGAVLNVLESMAQNTLQVQYAIAMNDFGRNLMNTLDPDTDHSVDGMNITSFFDGLDNGGNLFKLDGGEKPQFSIYEDGYIQTFDITEDMYISLKPTEGILSKSIPFVSDLNNLRRNLITAYNPWFTLKNATKDIQEVLINSQHPLETYATIKTAIEEIYTDGEWFQEYMEHGGGSDISFDMKHSEFGEGKGVTAFAETKTPLKYILKANNVVEMIPRLSEYIASRQAGRSIEVSMLDAARVTTNFNAGGDFTKFLNRNGATFLNASVQGAMQQVRNIREAYHAGFKGWASLAARYAVAGIPHFLLNGLIWDDDEDYQALPDYITNNYYVVWKYGDGKFIRIPKGRTAAVIQNTLEKVIAASSGDDEADWNEWWKLLAENIAPNNPVTDNMFAPIGQAVFNTSWYGEDIVPYRLRVTKDEDGNEIAVPKEEQFDEKTDKFSITLGQWLGMSPKKINYLLDQYGGVLGDTLLPMGTPKAESPIDNPAMKLLAPLRDIFTTDSVLNNRVTGDFYETLEAAEAKAKSEDATSEDKLRSGILISANVKISELMKEQREIQTSDMSDSEKYKLNRELKEEINALQEEALSSLENVVHDGKYAEAGGKRYSYNEEKDSWWEVSPKLADGRDNPYYVQEQLSHDKLGMSYADFWNGERPPEDFEGKTYYAEYNGKRYNYDTEKNGWFEIKPKKNNGEDNWYYQQEQIAHNDLGVSYEDFWNNRDAYSDVIYVASNGVDLGYGTPYYETVKSAIGLEKFTQIAGQLADIKTAVDENGNDIPYSKYQQVKEYVYGLDIPDIEKHIIFRAEYPNTKTHAAAIVRYLDQNPDISYESFYKILDELGYKVTSSGLITW